jgi:hypothetical protein
VDIRGSARVADAKNRPGECPRVPWIATLATARARIESANDLNSRKSSGHQTLLCAALFIRLYKKRQESLSIF